MTDPFDSDNTPVFKFALREGLDDSFLPTKGTPLATGWDVKAAWEDGEAHELRCGEVVKIPLGIRCFAPPGWWFELRPRSSTFAKKNLHCLYGVCDEDYSGMIMLAVQYLPTPAPKLGDIFQTYCLKVTNIDFGESLGQIVPVRRQEMLVEKVSQEELEALVAERKDTRGSGGFGSTSK